MLWRPAQIFLTIHFAKQLLHVKNPGLRDEMIGRLLRGDLVICGAYTEPGCGSDAAAITTRAVKEGDYYVVNGEKAFVSEPGISDIYIISARTWEGAPKPHLGISLLLVEREREGVEPYELKTMATEYEGDFGGVRFTDVEVPSGHLVGEENMGFKLLMAELSMLRVHVVLLGLGTAEMCLEEAIKYAKQRKAFGKPISKFQGVSFRLAEHWTKLEAARLLAYKALWLADRGKPSMALASAAKWYGCEVAFYAINDALQTLGAAGYTADYPLERAFRLVRGLLIGDGTTNIQKLIISRTLFGREYAP